MKKISRKIRPICQKFLDLYFSAARSSGAVGDADFHVDFMVHIASVLRPKCYVELGVYQCETFNRVSRFAERSYAVDINSDASCYMRAKRAQFFHGTSLEFCDVLKSRDEKVDMLFIDANHSYDSVMQEFSAFLPLVSEQGMIFLHDSFPLDQSHAAPELCGDAFRAVMELAGTAHGYEMVTVPFPPGLTMCRKRSAHLPWLT